jgi:uncharacterized CHY-type Zn-finger protein
MIKISQLLGGLKPSSQTNNVFDIKNVLTSVENLTDESKLERKIERRANFFENSKRKRIQETFLKESKLELCTEIREKKTVVIDMLRPKQVVLDESGEVSLHQPKKKRISVVESVFTPSDENILCSTCKKIFCSREKFDTHQCNELWTCYQCNKTLQKTSRRQHEAIHSNKKKYVCGLCNKKFFQQGNLTTHIQNCHSHKESSVVYRCDVEGCKSSPFKHEYDLRQHKRIHMEVSPFLCSEPGCGERFNQKNNLLIHIDCIHKGKKYICEDVECGKKFRTKYALKYHQIEYHPTEEDLKELLSFHEREGRWPTDDKKIDTVASVRLMRRMMEQMKKVNGWSSDEDFQRLLCLLSY